MFALEAKFAVRQLFLIMFGCWTVGILAPMGSVALAQQAGPEAICPKGYELIGTTPPYCSSRSGDVVELTTTRQRTSDCPVGYDWLADLCFSSVTGDIVLAAERSAPSAFVGTPK